MKVHPAARYVATVALLAAVLAGLGLLAKLPQQGIVSLIYPITGIAAALLWGFGVRWWPALVIAQFAMSMRTSHSVWISTLVASTELLVVLLFCVAMKRFRVSRELSRVHDVTTFVVATFLTTTAGGIVTAVGETFFVKQATTSRIAFDALSFWLSDFVSVLIFVPLILGWRRWPFPTRLSFQRWLALSALLITIGAAIGATGDPASSALFLLLPIVVFVAITAGVPGTSAAGTILLFILLGTRGANPDSRIDAIIPVVFVGTATATGYLLAAVWGEREQSARRLFHLAHHDPLTGMFNRHELETRLQRAVKSGPPSAHALLYLDLDQFKLVNDTCGHIAGDRMLQELAAELQHVVPRDASFARLGGDEFALLLLNATTDDALAVANALHDATQRYRFHFGSMSFAVGVSIGITLFPSEDGDNADAVLGRADVACYVAKEDGRHRSHIYLPRDEAMRKWHSSIHEVSQLEMAMANGALQLYRQAIIDISGTPSPNFHEVLLRLASGDDVRASAEFLPVAQRFGLMDRIDRWVLDHACRFLASNGNRNLKLSVNVSGSTFNDPDFYSTVIAIPERYGIDPRQLCLEVTESVMIHRLRQAAEAMKMLRERGFDLALDDFGAGVASFAYLGELPVTYVKIDGRIVRDLRTDPASEVIVGSLVRLARLREIECIAEWVESEETIDRLRALGVRYAQGFYLDVPSPLTEPLARADVVAG